MTKCAEAPAPELSHRPPSPTSAGYNPFIGKIQGVFATFVQEPVITGCVPQANFYTLYNQVGLGALSSPCYPGGVEGPCSKHLDSKLEAP